MLAVFRRCFLALTRVTTTFHTPLLPISSVNQQTRWPSKPNPNCSQQMCVCAILAPHHIRAMIPHRENIDITASSYDIILHPTPPYSQPRIEKGVQSTSIRLTSVPLTHTTNSKGDMVSSSLFQGEKKKSKNNNTIII